MPKADRAAPATRFPYVNSIATTPTPDTLGLTLAQTLASLSRRTTDLSQALGLFSFPGGAHPAFFKSASVSDPSRATAGASGTAGIAAYRLGIDRLATAGTLQSSVLVRDATTGLAHGAHTFNLIVDDTTATLSISVDKNGATPDTNADVLRLIARAVESADSSLAAEVGEGRRKVYSTLSDSLYEDTVQLRIRSRDTGAAAGFSLEDAGEGTIISDLQLDRIAVPAAAAQYSLNSMPASSDANTVTADAGNLTIGLLAPTGSTPVTIRVAEGIAPLQQNITDLVAAYNDYVQFLDRNSRFLNPALKNNLVRDLSAISRDLQAIGLELTGSGTIDVTDRFEKALRTDSSAVRSALTGTDGLFTKVNQHLSSVLANGARSYARTDLPPGRAVGFSVFA
jgi:flagellar capping protein FliD